MWYDIFFTNFAAVVVFFLVLLLLITTISRPANLPPGPRPWPLIGNFPNIRGDVLKILQDLRQQYGDVYTLYLGREPTVFVYGQKFIREMLVTRGDEFADRAQSFITKEISNGKGVVSTSGRLWSEQRRFTLHTLRDFGFGKSSLEGKVMEEVEVLIQCLKDKNGETFQIGKLVHTSVSNVICSIVFGDRFDHDDPRFVRHMKAIDENFEAVALSGGLNYFPWLKYLPGDLFHFHRSIRNLHMIEDFILEEIKSHKETINPDIPRDFIDAFLVEMDKSKKMSPNTTFDDEQLLKVIGDLFVAGSETTGTTLLWALLFMVNYPDVQTKIRSEIHAVIGKSRFPSMADRKNMPYMEATLMEIQRCGDIAPLLFPHAPSHDTTLSGYTIPKGTAVVAVLASLHKDPGVFGDPDVFNPERFLDSDGNVTKSEHLLPFSAGKRVCLGESLARMELFLFLTSMLQRFVFKAPDGMTSLPEDRILGIAQKPVPYKIRAIFDD